MAADGALTRIIVRASRGGPVAGHPRRRAADRSLRARPERRHPPQARGRWRDAGRARSDLCRATIAATARHAPQRGSRQRATTRYRAGATTPWTATITARSRLPYPASHERLWRDDHLYDILVVLDWNLMNPRPYGGSAIFFHLASPDFSPDRRLRRRHPPGDEEDPRSFRTRNVSRRGLGPAAENGAADPDMGGAEARSRSRSRRSFPWKAMEYQGLVPFSLAAQNAGRAPRRPVGCT